MDYAIQSCLKPAGGFLLHLDRVETPLLPLNSPHDQDRDPLPLSFSSSDWQALCHLGASPLTVC